MRRGTYDAELPMANDNKPHKTLDVWKVSVELVSEIYRLTESPPVGKKDGLVTQMRRAAVSMPMNIAEGAARNTKKELTQFLHIAKGSLNELDTYLEITRKLG